MWDKRPEERLGLSPVLEVVVEDLAALFWFQVGDVDNDLCALIEGKSTRFEMPPCVLQNVVPRRENKLGPALDCGFDFGGNALPVVRQVVIELGRTERVVKPKQLSLVGIPPFGELRGVFECDDVGVEHVGRC